MASLKRSKLHHHGPEEVVYAFKVHQNNQDPYEPLKLELCSDGRVRASQDGQMTEPHGCWTLGDDGILTTLWHYKGDIVKAKLQYFIKIPCTDAYERINCDSNWRSILIPWKDN